MRVDKVNINLNGLDSVSLFTHHVTVSFLSSFWKDGELIDGLQISLLKGEARTSQSLLTLNFQLLGRIKDIHYTDWDSWRSPSTGSSGLENSVGLTGFDHCTDEW